MKKIFLILVICMSTFMLSACGKKMKGIVNDLSFEFSKSFSNCEKSESQYDCTYKNKDNFCSLSVSTAVPLVVKDTKEAVEFLLFVDNDIKVEYNSKEINGNVWATGYVKNDGENFQRKLYLINDYNGRRYEISYYCSLDTDLSNEDFQSFENSLQFK